MDSRRARRAAVSAVVAVALAGLGADAAAAAPAQPDLFVKRVSFRALGTTSGGNGQSTVIGAGATLRIAERTKNAGGGFARRSTTRYFLRSDDGVMTLIGSRSVGTLGPGESSGDVTEPVYGDDLGIGAGRIVACADGRRGVAESRERNNCRMAPGRIVVRADARPVIAGGAAMGGFTEDGPPVPVDTALTVSDADDANLTGATVRMLGGGLGTGARLTGDPGVDWFLFAGQLGITGTFEPGTGTLTLTGSAPVSDYQSALRSVLYQHLGDGPPASRSVQFVVRDAKGVPSAPGTKTIAIERVNDAPRVFVIVEALPYRSGSGPKPIAPGLALFDPDSEIAGATVRISSGFVSSQDALAFANQLGITGTYNAGTGVLTLTGAASPDSYRTALRSVTVASTGSGQRTIAFQVTDARGAASEVAFVQQQYIDF